MATRTGCGPLSGLMLCLLYVGCGSLPPAQAPAPLAHAPARAIEGPKVPEKALAPVGIATIAVLDGVLFAAVTGSDRASVYRFEGEAWASVGEPVDLNSIAASVPVVRTLRGDPLLVLTDDEGQPRYVHSLGSGVHAEVSTPGRLVSTDELVVARTLVDELATAPGSYLTALLVERWNGVAFEEVLRKELSRAQPVELKRAILRDGSPARPLIAGVCEAGGGCRVGVVTGSRRRQRYHDLAGWSPSGGLVASGPPAVRVAFTTAPSEDALGQIIVKRLRRRNFVDEPALPLGVATDCQHVPLDLSGDPPLLVVSECMPDGARQIRVLRLFNETWVDAWPPWKLPAGRLEAALLLGDSLVVLIRSEGIALLFRGSPDGWEPMPEPPPGRSRSQ